MTAVTISRNKKEKNTRVRVPVRKAQVKYLRIIIYITYSIILHVHWN